MIAKSKKFDNFRKVLPYVLITAGIIGLAFFGSLGKDSGTGGNINMESIAKNNYTATADQVSELYIVSELASNLDLPTAEAVNVNYNSLTLARATGQTTTDKIEKPSVLNISACRGIDTYTVKEGETLESIANKYNLTTTQIRWSNGLKNDTISAGQTLSIPCVPGIVYTVKSGDTVDSIAEKYSSTAASIIAANDLEKNPALTPAMKLIIPNGELPQTERPEYVAPTSNRGTSSSSSYSAYRTYWTSSNPMPWGWCTWYAWARRAQMSAEFILPGGLGNANTWDNALSSTFRIDRSPSVGAVMQTDSGWYGHVAIVDSVNADGSVTFSDMNGVSGWGRVGSRTISASEAASYKYIHERL